MPRCDYSAGDKIIVRWHLLDGVPATIGRVFTTCDIDAVLDPQILEQMKVPRQQTYVLSDDGKIHLTLARGEFEVIGKKVQVD
jgi:hypothetical protein